PPAGPGPLPRPSAPVEADELLAGAARAGGRLGLRARALVEVLYGTGARISEVVPLSADDLDLGGSHPSVRLFGKGRKERIVPIGRYAVEALEAYIVRGRPVLAQAGRGSSAVFLNQRGNPLSRQSAWAALQAAAERGGLE